ncbi:MAG: cob(I)yrinic acid a,c-diamide adenosyltransferase [Candidatus Micrarchaeaceae archaeon]
MKYYTGKGDNGNSSTIAFANIPKSDPIFDAIGNVDELNSVVGIAIFHIKDEALKKMLESVQNDLFILGAELASMRNNQQIPIKIAVSDKMSAKLEEEIGRLSEKLPELKEFVIPGGTEGALYLQFARTIARRVERSIIAASEKYKISSEIKKYANRLSTLLFVMALYVNFQEKTPERHPKYDA